MKPKDCKTCRYAHLVKHTEHHKDHPDYLEGRCRIPMFARIVTKRNKEYCKDYEPRETAKPEQKGTKFGEDSEDA